VSQIFSDIEETSGDICDTTEDLCSLWRVGRAAQSRAGLICRNTVGLSERGKGVLLPNAVEEKTGG
jgi:hypothetical protein